MDQFHETENEKRKKLSFCDVSIDSSSLTAFFSANLLNCSYKLACFKIELFVC